MTTEEKAKAYDEALEKARKYHAAAKSINDSSATRYENIFPQLRESEDEKIYREIYSIVNHSYQVRIDNLVSPERKKEYLDKWEKVKDWLEKHKEQKPNIELIQRSWYMEGYHDREFGKEPKWIVKTDEGGPRYEENPKYGQMLAEQKTAEWSEEDEQFLLICKNSLYKYQLTDQWDANIISKWLEERLKSNRPRSSWKPSEEQMNAFSRFITYCITQVHAGHYKQVDDIRLVEQVYKQLKKL